MAEEPKTPIENEDDELLLTEEVGKQEPDDEGDDDEEEEIPSFGDEASEQDTDSGLVKHLRNEIKRARQEAAEARKSAPPQKVEVGPKPTMWDDEIGGDEDKYDAAMEKWRTAKATVAEQTQAATSSNEEQQRAWEARIAPLATEKAALAKPDADEAFETVKAALGDAKFLAIAGMVDEGKKAQLIYALAKNPDRLASLADQSDPILLVKEVTRLEGQLKMVKRRKAPEPDRPERGSAKMAPRSADKRLAKLEEEADRTGERTELIAYKKKLAEAAKK